VLGQPCSLCYALLLPFCHGQNSGWKEAGTFCLPLPTPPACLTSCYSHTLYYILKQGRGKEERALKRGTSMSVCSHLLSSFSYILPAMCFCDVLPTVLLQFFPFVPGWKVKWRWVLGGRDDRHWAVGGCIW